MQHEAVCDFVTNGLTTVAYDLWIDLDMTYRESEQNGSSISDVTDGIDGA